MVAFAASASAATLSIVSDKTTYNVGETISLTVTGDDVEQPPTEFRVASTSTARS
jgi:hypothetical protein